jgi:hypothetical protein
VHVVARGAAQGRPPELGKGCGGPVREPPGRGEADGGGVPRPRGDDPGRQPEHRAGGRRGRRGPRAARRVGARARQGQQRLGHGQHAEGNRQLRRHHRVRGHLTPPHQGRRRAPEGAHQVRDYLYFHPIIVCSLILILLVIVIALVVDTGR